MAQTVRESETSEQARHPNAQRLLDTAIELLNETQIEHIHLSTVLQRSGISNGSLYHHFEDFQDLIEQAIVQRFTKGLNDSHAEIAKLLDITDESIFRERVKHIVFAFHDQSRRPFRMARLETLGALMSRPRLAERIGRAQFESNMKQAGYFAELQNRGWFRSDLDSAVVSTFMTSTFLGRVVDDIASEQVDANEWKRVSWVAFEAILFGDQPVGAKRRSN
jgi:AcrR family transcriptional regulator